MEYTLNDVDVSDKTFITFLFQNKFMLGMLRICRDCGHEMNLIHSSHFDDGFEFRCHRASCKRRESIRVGSIFEGHKLTLKEMFRVMIHFVSGSKVHSTALALDLNRNTVSDLFQLFRERYAQIMESSPVEFTGEIFEADELRINRVKDPATGHILHHVWVFGMAERDSSQAFLKRVDRTDGATLVGLIKQYAPPGSIIMTDEKNSYHVLDHEDSLYAHYAVSHSAQDYQHMEIGPQDQHLNVHINTIEGLNREVRHRLSNKSVRTLDRLDIELGEMMYRKSGRGLFDPFKIEF